MKIELKCSCGATAIFSDDQITYVDGCGFLNLRDGEPGEHRPLVIEMLAENWMEMHLVCLKEKDRDKQ